MNTTSSSTPLHDRLENLREVLGDFESRKAEHLTSDEGSMLQSAVESVWPNYFRRQYWLQSLSWFALGAFVAKYALVG